MAKSSNGDSNSTVLALQQPLTEHVVINSAFDEKQRDVNEITLDDDTDSVTMLLPCHRHDHSSNKKLNREIHGCTNIVFYSAMLLSSDACRQVTSYGMKYYNHDVYPLPQTQIVATAEALKFTVFFILLVLGGSLSQIRVSAWYAVPSLIYAINNNVYYLGLHYTTPPIWTIIIQLRIVLTALTYKLFFGRTVTATQWTALLLLTLSVVGSYWSGYAGDSQRPREVLADLDNMIPVNPASVLRDGFSNSTGDIHVGAAHKHSLLIAFALGFCGSVMSVIGTIIMEFLFKNDSRSFNEMQMQLYLFGTLGAWSLYLLQANTGQEKIHITGPHGLVVGLAVGDILLSSASGFAVAIIVKRLDNIVKLYTQALANMFTATACALLFPDRFRIDILFVLCLVGVVVAILMYESPQSLLMKPGSRFQDRLMVVMAMAQAYRLTCASVALTSVVALGLLYSYTA